MAAFLVHRIVQALFVALIMAVVAFLAIYAIGNPIDVLVSPEADFADRAAITAQLGLDKPLHEQFLLFLSNALKGNLGNSFIYNEPALQIIVQRMPATLELALAGLLLSLGIGVPLGIIAGLAPHSPTGRTIMLGSIFGFSIPGFWLGLILLLVFSVHLGWLPASGRGATVDLLGVPVALLTLDGLKHLILPAITLALYKIALVTRVAQSATRETMLQDYIRMARAKGLSETRIVIVHLLKNIMLPIITVVGLELGSMIAFAIVTESVFSYPGMGKLLIDSILRLDRPVVVAYLMIVVIVFIIINLVADILYAALDPRIRLSK